MTDRSLVKKPRPVVFSLAELQRYPTLEDRYAITLPFSCYTVDCYCPYPKGGIYWRHHCEECEPWIEYPKVKAECIKRTAERWAWFSAARDLDDERGQRLGTLGYLPWEIRQEIMNAVIADDMDYYPKQMVDDQLIDRRIYPRIFLGHGSRSYGIRFASPSTKVEFEYCYLTKTDFVFYEPEQLKDFLDKLSIHQQSLLRSFTLEVHCPGKSPSSLSKWAAVCPRLPSNLLSIGFDGWIWVDCAMGAGGEWFIRDDSWYFSQRAIDALDLLGKRARRFAARAKIGLGARYSHLKFHDPSGEGWVRVLHELEPWSETWLNWWEEASKVDSDDGEGAIEMAQVTG